MRFGIEAEFALVHPERGFCDFSTLSYGQAQAIVDRLPDHGDPDLTRGDLAVKVTRWYVEGDERFAEDGTFLRCVPKGLETRTPVLGSIGAAVDQLAVQTEQLAAAEVLDVGRKLTALSPVLVPFSFSSPFAGGSVVALSARTLLRAPVRPSARVFLAEPRPPVGVRARIPAELGRVEFKAFDAPPDPALYPALLALVTGLALDRTLPDRADRPDPVAHTRAARVGFADDDLRDRARTALDAAERALTGTLDAGRLAPLRDLLDRRRTPAHDLIDTFRRTGEIPLPTPGIARQP